MNCQPRPRRPAPHSRSVAAEKGDGRISRYVVRALPCSQGADLVVLLMHLAVRPDDHLCAVLLFNIFDAEHLLVREQLRDKGMRGDDDLRAAVAGHFLYRAEYLIGKRIRRFHEPLALAIRAGGAERPAETFP